MRRLAYAFAIVVIAGVVPAYAQGSAPTKPAPSYDAVIAAPGTSVGQAVSWVVRFRSVLVDVGPDGSVTRIRTLFEYLDGESWQGRTVIGPPPQEIKWMEPPFAGSEPQMQRRLISGTIAAVEHTTAADGRRVVTPILRDIALEHAPGPFAPGNGVSWPTATYMAKPRYTPEAMRAKIEGAVELKMVVQSDGTVGDVTVVKSLDSRYGLDAAAIEAAKKWRFTPGMKDGKPVATIVAMSLEFRMSK